MNPIEALTLFLVWLIGGAGLWKGWFILDLMLGGTLPDFHPAWWFVGTGVIVVALLVHMLLPAGRRRR